MELFVGIDVAKGTLAVAQSTGEQWSCANDADGIARLLERLVAARPALVVLEATGGYEGELLTALIAAGIEARRVNPRQVRHFARLGDNWPRPIGSTPKCWRSSLSASGRRLAPCPSQSARNSRRWSPAAASWCRC